MLEILDLKDWLKTIPIALVFLSVTIFMFKYTFVGFGKYFAAARKEKRELKEKRTRERSEAREKSYQESIRKYYADYTQPQVQPQAYNQHSQHKNSHSKGSYQASQYQTLHYQNTQRSSNTQMQYQGSKGTHHLSSKYVSKHTQNNFTKNSNQQNGNKNNHINYDSIYREIDRPSYQHKNNRSQSPNKP